MIISTIQKGNVKSGIRYVPVFIIISLAMFFIFQKVLGIMLGAFFSGI